jgi:carbon storage regulator
MLCISRKAGEAIHIGDNVIVRVLRVSPSGQVRLGIDAPRSVTVHRDEIAAEIAEQNRLASWSRPTQLLGPTAAD